MRLERRVLHGVLFVGSSVIPSLVACGPASDGSHDPRWQAVTDTVGDTVRVRTISGSVLADTATMAAEVSIGSLAADDEYVIGDPRSIAIDRDGVIYVLDTQVPVLRAYAPDGTALGAGLT